MIEDFDCQSEQDRMHVYAACFGQPEIRRGHTHHAKPRFLKTEERI